MRLKRAASGICAAVAGRHIHPVGMEVGGFSFTPSGRSLAELRRVAESAVEDLQAMLPLFREHSWPDFQRETDYISLKHPHMYAFYEGELFSSRQGPLAVRDYRRSLKEYTVSGSNAKHAAHNDAPYMVGALARFNNNSEQLAEPARRMADEIGLRSPCTNPFMIPAAQMVETAHCLDDSITLIDRLLGKDTASQSLQVDIQPRASRGVGAVEAPRGTLFHE
jgi:coenzyme F420-reducing hydrogenase alpha subunit